MSTLIPLSGETTEIPPPKSESEVARLLGSPGTVRYQSPDGSSWWASDPRSPSQNERATRFYNSRSGRVPDTQILYGEVLYLSAEETKAFAGVSDKEEYVPVKGRTYDVRGSLKSLGARWNPDEKVWKVPKSRLAEAEEIVRKGP